VCGDLSVTAFGEIVVRHSYLGNQLNFQKILSNSAAQGLLQTWKQV